MEIQCSNNLCSKALYPFLLIPVVAASKAHVCSVYVPFFIGSVSVCLRKMINAQQLNLHPPNSTTDRLIK